ncbi:MAG: G5 domain-containing protein [Patescibacteria group bacterium]|nr:G5 domain-containing protein [Patescibacteria group bacterium]
MIKQIKIKKVIQIIAISLIIVGGCLHYAIKLYYNPVIAPIDQRMNFVTVNYDNHYFKAHTLAKTVGDFLEEQGLSLEEGDCVFPNVKNQLVPGTLITIRRQIPMTIKVDDREIAIRTFAETINEVLVEADVTLNHLDKIKPGKLTRTTRNSEIVITRINEEEITEEERIDFKVIEKDDSKLKWRRTKIGQVGEAGVRENTYLITYANGKQVSKVKLSSEIIKKPVTKIILHGTKIEIGESYKGRASWYSHTGTMACASLKHPFGTWLRVTNMANGKNVIVQVNDRGPFSEDKIIDLDKTAFAKIGNLAQGVMRVKVEEILE